MDLSRKRCNGKNGRVNLTFLIGSNQEKGSFSQISLLKISPKIFNFSKNFILFCFQK